MIGGYCLYDKTMSNKMYFSNILYSNTSSPTNSPTKSKKKHKNHVYKINKLTK